MKKRIQTFLKTNPGYKLLAVLLAFLLWLMVYNTTDPNITRTFTVNVELLNTEVFNELNKCYEIANGTEAVTFAIVGPRSVVDNLMERDFTATADMDKLVLSKDEKTASVLIEIKAVPRYSSYVKFKSKTKKMEMELENRETKQFVVQAEALGEVAPGYTLGSAVVTNPNVLKVSGPESIVKSIDRVVATIDVEGMSLDISDNVIPKLYDEKGDMINTTRLTFSNTTVSIRADILGVKEVPLRFAAVGETAGENTVINGIRASVENIMIKGDTAQLSDVTEIMIPGSALNVQGAEGDVVTNVDITSYLPDGIELLNPGDAIVRVTVLMETYGTKTINVPTESLTVEGLDSKYDITFDASAISLTVSGSDSNLALLAGSNVGGTLSVRGLNPGLHNVQVHFDLDPGKYSYTPVKATVTLTEKTEE